MNNDEYIRAIGINYAGAIQKINKSADQLQPIYEAFTNSLEAIKCLNNSEDTGTITLKLSLRKTLFSTDGDSYDFESIIIEDSGIGFNQEEFERFINLNDAGKRFFNKGTGRVQYLHYFDKTEYSSVFAETSSPTGYKQRNFIFSKNDAFLKQNAIIRKEEPVDFKATASGTILTFKNPLTEKDSVFYRSLTIEELKKSIITHYLAFLCENRIALPKIKIQYLINAILDDEIEIKSEDIPEFEKQKDLVIHYCKILPDGKSVEKTTKSEVLNLKGFRIKKEDLKKNSLKLTSKGEIAKEIKLENLLPEDEIEGQRYLFLLSGDYINKKDTDNRGNLNILNLDEFKKKAIESELFIEEEILLDDIKETANVAVLEMYDEIVTRKEEKNKDIEKLEKMFLLNPISIRDAKIKLTDTDEEILEKVYRADAKIIAKKDAEIKKRVDSLDSLNPSAKDFNKRFLEEIDELTKAIPLQNRTELTHYVARRKLVLDLLGKILDNKLEIQQTRKSNLDEALIHNLLFQKGSDNPENSSLWIINEDFIYFSGVSEKQLAKVEINGEKMFKEIFSIKEEEYLNSLGENRKAKRPDVLLFPDEGKCIIIEFKSPDVNAADHLAQINFYANLIRNYSEDKFQLTTFFGYLIGESIEPRDVLGRVTSFEYSYQFDYLYRPSEKVVGFDGRTNGSIYTEVIKYSTLLERARKRNSIFIDKL